MIFFHRVLKTWFRFFLKKMSFPKIHCENFNSGENCLIFASTEDKAQNKEMLIIRFLLVFYF